MRFKINPKTFEFDCNERRDIIAALDIAIKQGIKRAKTSKLDDNRESIEFSIARMIDLKVRVFGED